MTELVTEHAVPEAVTARVAEHVEFRTDPNSYRHWRLQFDGRVAVLLLDVDEHSTLQPGYELKLNSYDLGVDIELYDAVQRLRFEHPEVGAVVITSGKDRIFCAGANIKMLASATHAAKVNFCKFTNETRNGIEDATQSSGQRYLAALNGTASGGGYELALACDRILLLDDNSSAVSLPELPLLGVLPGTGGLTRLVDKRFVRKDLADVFSTKAEGVSGQRAQDWGLVDELVPPSQWAETVGRRAAEAAADSGRPKDAEGIALPLLKKERSEPFVSYPHVSATLNRVDGVVSIVLRGPDEEPPANTAELRSQGANFWTLALTRELDDLILDLRANEIEFGTWIIRTEGAADAVLAHDRFLLEHRGDWLVEEIVHYLKRTLKRLDVTSRSLIALVEPGSCFAGSLLELMLASDRSFQLAGQSEDFANAEPATIVVGEMNLGLLPMCNGLARLESRFFGDSAGLERVKAALGQPIEGNEALELGLTTFAPDEIDWEDEIRVTLEERVSFSPDALTGLEANYRFVGPETLETKIFGRLSAWQNWIFNRPNASGPEGALRRYGTGQRAQFDRKRV